MNNYLEADKKRWNGYKGKLSFLPQYKFIRIKRKCEQYRERNKLLFLFYRFIYERYKTKYTMDVPARVKIGKGFRIEHIGGIVINPDAVIGENVTIYNGALIGMQNRGSRKGVPTIGNYVFIGANSVIVGKVNIGNNVLIAPGAYVNFDVPDNSIVLGNPGKIIPKEDATKDYILNPV